MLRKPQELGYRDETTPAATRRMGVALDEFVGPRMICPAFGLDGRSVEYDLFRESSWECAPAWISDDGRHAVHLVADEDWEPPTSVLVESEGGTCVGFYAGGELWIDEDRRGQGLSKPLRPLSRGSVGEGRLRQSIRARLFLRGLGGVRRCEQNGCRAGCGSGHQGAQKSSGDDAAAIGAGAGLAGPAPTHVVVTGRLAGAAISEGVGRHGVPRSLHDRRSRRRDRKGAREREDARGGP